MGSPIKFEESADEGDKWSKIQMGIQAGKSKKKNKTMEAQATPLPLTPVSQEVSTAKPVELIDMNSVTSPSPVKVTVRPIKQVEYHEFIQELESSFDGEATTLVVDDRFLIDAPAICPIGTKKDHNLKCRKII